MIQFFDSKHPAKLLALTHPFQLGLLCLILWQGAFAQRPSTQKLLFAPFENLAELSTENAYWISEIFYHRLGTFSGWELLDSNQQDALNPLIRSGQCYQDCLIQASQKAALQMILTGVIRSTDKPGIYQVEAVLYDAVTWKTLQKEHVLIGSDIRANLGQISALARFFDPHSASSYTTAPPPEEDRVSQSANWVLGISALSILVLVLYTIM